MGKSHLKARETEQSRNKIKYYPTREGPRKCGVLEVQDMSISE